MKKEHQIMDVALPHPEAADLTTKAAQVGVSTSEYLGIQVLTAAYGHLHPEVVAFKNRAKPGINGPKTPKSPEDIQ